jgi:hypothetical protein
MIISIHAEKAFDKIQHPFIIKPPMKLRIEGMYLNIIKAICDKPIDIILNREKPKPFSLKSGTRKGYPFIPLLFKIVLEFLDRGNKTIKKFKRNSNRKGRSQTLPICR